MFTSLYPPPNAPARSITALRSSTKNATTVDVMTRNELTVACRRYLPEKNLERHSNVLFFVFWGFFLEGVEDGTDEMLRIFPKNNQKSTRTLHRLCVDDQDIALGPRAKMLVTWCDGHV